jgi:hypothetical protein
LRAYIANRLLQTLVVIVGISMIAFTITYLVGDPLAVLLPLDAPKEQRDVYRHSLGLDQPLPVQYYHFVARVATGNFGDSYVIHKPAYELIFERMPAWDHKRERPVVAMIHNPSAGGPPAEIERLTHRKRVAHKRYFLAVAKRESRRSPAVVTKPRGCPPRISLEQEKIHRHVFGGTPDTSGQDVQSHGQNKRGKRHQKTKLIF